jgi:hypothetical protein
MADVRTVYCEGVLDPGVYLLRTGEPVYVDRPLLEGKKTCCVYALADYLMIPGGQPDDVEDRYELYGDVAIRADEATLRPLGKFVWQAGSSPLRAVNDAGVSWTLQVNGFPASIVGLSRIWSWLTHAGERSATEFVSAEALLKDLPRELHGQLKRMYDGALADTFRAVDELNSRVWRMSAEDPDRMLRASQLRRAVSAVETLLSERALIR